MILALACIGDFNDLLSEKDKAGGLPHPKHLFRGFWDIVDAC